MTRVTAGYGTIPMSTTSGARWRKPAMLTPGSRPGREGVAMSQMAAASRAHSSDSTVATL